MAKRVLMEEDKCMEGGYTSFRVVRLNGWCEGTVLGSKGIKWMR